MNRNVLIADRRKSNPSRSGGLSGRGSAVPADRIRETRGSNDTGREHQSTNSISKPTGNIAVHNVNKEAELQAKDRLLEMAMSKLSSMQREVIQRSYLDDEGEFDYISCGEMGMSDSTFRRIKADAIGILASALRLEILNNIDEISNEVG